MRPKWSDFWFERADFRPEQVDFGSDKADFGPERTDFKSERTDFGPERADLRPEGPRGGWTYGRTDVRKFIPVSYRTLALWGRCPKVKL